MTASPTCPLCASLRASDPSPLTRIATLRECDVFLNDQQGCPGWCVCVLREHAEHLDELTIERQQALFAEVARVARAIRAVFPTSGQANRPPRINYECLGNVTPHIHWHVIPRHANDASPRAAVWGQDPATLKGTMPASQRTALAAQIAGHGIVTIVAGG